MSQSFIKRQREQPRDPIMDDDAFSLQFGNPIKVIHDAQPSSNTTTPTPIHHVPSYLPSLKTTSNGSGNDHDSSKATTTHQQQSDHRTASPLHKRVPSDSSTTRDVANFAEFYHNQEGKVYEIDHEESNKRKK